MGGALLMKKSTDALATSTEDTDRHLDSKYHLEAESNYEDLSIQRTNTANKILGTYSHVKKSTHMPILTNRTLFGTVPTAPSEHFKQELNMKIKSFNVPNDAEHRHEYQMEQISTATTSLSSASSCTSNSEMTKEVTCRPKLAPLASDLTDSYSSDKIPAANSTSSNTYSLLKTTLNVKGASEALEQQLSQSALRLSNNKAAGAAAKPPILKPKPKTNGSNPSHAAPKGSAFNNSLHNQSTEPLIAHAKEASLNTSPSTSVTDVSSNNLTPQHANNPNVSEEVTAATVKRTLNNYQPTRPATNGKSTFWGADNL